jgi:hypothetical protein
MEGRQAKEVQQDKGEVGEGKRVKTLLYIQAPFYLNKSTCKLLAL